MNVAPQGYLKIIKNVGWTNDKKHNRLFANRSARDTYMANKTKYNLDNFTYIREQNVIRVPIEADNLFDCNYIMYQNKGFGTKWFYAWITDVKYVNNVTSEISFEVDNFQTWLFDFEVKACYVEREHVADDTVGKHIVEENVGTGELVIQGLYKRFYQREHPDQPLSPSNYAYKLAVQVQPTLMGELIGSDNILNFSDKENAYYPVTHMFDCDGQAQTLSDIFGLLSGSSLTGKRISNCYIFPKEFTLRESVNISLKTDGNLERPTQFKDINDGTQTPYKPKNNKLLSYPYVKLLATSSEGQSQEFRWENFSVGLPVFQIVNQHCNDASCCLRPQNYMSEPYDRLHNVSILNFPKVTLPTFESMNVASLGKTLLSSISNLKGAYTQPMTMKEGTNIPTEVSTNAHKYNIEQTWGRAQGNIAQGVLNLATDSGTKQVSTMGDMLNLANEEIGFIFYSMGLKPQNAKVIDSYLTRFGYAVNEIKVPELHSRKSFNYIKTAECDITGDVPMTALSDIEDMFNNGITLWHIDDIGNFNADNSIIPQGV